MPNDWESLKYSKFVEAKYQVINAELILVMVKRYLKYPFCYIPVTKQNWGLSCFSLDQDILVDKFIPFELKTLF